MLLNKAVVKFHTGSIVCKMLSIVILNYPILVLFGTEYYHFIVMTIIRSEGQITPRKSRTPFVKILLFYLKIPGNPFVLGKISNAICTSELPLD